MFGRVRHWAIAGAAFASLGGGVLASSGVGPAKGQGDSRPFLPMIGPAPLRFRPVEQPATNLVHMALPPPKPEPAVNFTPSDESPPKKTAPPPAPPAAAPPQTAGVPASSEPSAAAPAADPLVSPQMLLRFFNHSTNGSSSGMLAPLDFAPPASAKPASGSATYSTTPN